MLAIKILSPHSIVWAIFIACRLGSGMSIVEAGCAPCQPIPTGVTTFRVDTTPGNASHNRGFKSKFLIQILTMLKNRSRGATNAVP